MTPVFPRVFAGIIDSALALNIRNTQIVGTTSSVVLAGYLSSEHSLLQRKTPQLVVTATEDAALAFAQDLRFFNPSLEAHLLEPFDVSPYSTLYPNYRGLAQRINWLYRAQYSLGHEIFIAPIQAILQKTLPQKILDICTRTFRINDNISADFLKTLANLGYQPVPRVEDVGQFSVKGGLIDIFSPAHPNPVRIELFGDTIDSLRFFSPSDQRSLAATKDFVVLPTREVLFLDETAEAAQKNILPRLKGSPEKESIYRSLVTKSFFPGIDFYLPCFYESLSSPLDFFTDNVNIWWLDHLDITRQSDLFLSDLLDAHRQQDVAAQLPKPSDLYSDLQSIQNSKHRTFLLSKVDISSERKEPGVGAYSYPVQTLGSLHALNKNTFEDLESKIHGWLQKHSQIIVATHTQGQAERILFILEKMSIPVSILNQFEGLPETTSPRVFVIPNRLSESVNIVSEDYVFLREEDFFGNKQVKRKAPSASKEISAILLSDLKENDLIVHVDHGVGIFQGLKTMVLQGIPSEFIQINYKDDDKLYLPVYRINLIRRYTGVSALDKLGNKNWEKTKIRVRNHLRDVASDLLSLYAKRSQIERPPYPPPDENYKSFEGQFPYDETTDQLKAIEEILNDLQKPSPMDRLICGDVGFGKTEVAMRAAFKVVVEKKQVAVLSPTTVLTFQHLETFRRRFKNWPVTIEALSRFSSRKDAAETVQKMKLGRVDIIIGTHRLLSKDISFKDLGLLIVDEEHKFGVIHKEKIKKMKTSVDTISMSATPIPRTLNMGFMGVRDLSLINTPPNDRLPTRTFLCPFEPHTIRKAILSEIHRGGQIFFLHNRVQSIHETSEKIREIAPEARVRVAHGQMPAETLEETMIAFFKHEFDVLVCTTIVESGMDIPRANTIFIDRADGLGLSQLYQLRGRVGRSKERAYCYLLIPNQRSLDPAAQERLKAIQENVELGRGVQIAHRDLELRGAGSILGEEQAGHANAVGYELYLELLENALREAKGDSPEIDSLEPEINLRIAALIPDTYMPDIRLRMAYYKAFSSIESLDDVDRFEEDLHDQFGPIPEPVRNLMGVMLIKKHAKNLGIRDLTLGTKNLSLAFTEHTSLSPQAAINLTLNKTKKYSLTPDSRLIIKLENQTWPAVLEELSGLEKLS